MEHTCLNQLVLPSYSTVEIVVEKIEVGAVGIVIAEGFHYFI